MRGSCTREAVCRQLQLYDQWTYPEVKECKGLRVGISLVEVFMGNFDVLKQFHM